MAADASTSGSKFSRKSKEHSVNIANTRRGGGHDVEAITSLVQPETAQLFGNIDVAELVEKCHITMCLENSEEVLVAAMCLDDHPNVPALPPSEWSHWLATLYQLNLVTPLNSLWIHLSVWDEAYTYFFAEPLLRAIFNSSNVLEYILAVIPPGAPRLTWIGRLGTRILPAGHSGASKVQTLYLLVRQRFVTRFKIRRAVEEDNDDLVPLIHTNTDMLVENYGEFYIAEMLTRHQDAGRQIIVAEYADRACAVLCLNETIDVDELNEQFELIPFYGLRKPHDSDVLQEEEEETVSIGMDEETEYSFAKKEDVSDTLSIYEENVDASKATLLSIASEDSDDFLLVDVSSVHLQLDEESVRNYMCSESSTDFTAMILSGDDYEKHLFTKKKEPVGAMLDEMDFIRSKKNYVPISNAQFYGEINAFTLEIAVSDLEYEAETLSLLLEAAFECFPDRDCCILTMPSTSPPIPITKFFVKVPPKPISSYPHELYVLHRNAILSTITVRPAVRYDAEEVRRLVSSVDYPHDILSFFVVAVNFDEGYRSYVMLSEDQIVGVAIVHEEDNYEYLMCNYDLSYWINEDMYKWGSHGYIDSLVVSPIFQKNIRYFLREMHRLSDFQVLYYYVHPSDVTTMSRKRCVCCAIGDLIAVRPRIKQEFSQKDSEDCSPSEIVTLQDDPFALFLSTSRLCTIQRYEVNRKIVVVGGSDTSIAFLDALLCSANRNYRVTFTDVTVVAPQGFDVHKSENKIRDMMFVMTGYYNFRIINMLALKTHVNLVNAVMTGIDRKNKKLFMSDSTILPYDYLFLICGEQFQKPILKQNLDKGFPDNVFLINSKLDSANAISKLKDLIYKKSQKNVIVYGHYLEAYCCIAALREFGLHGKHISFVESFPVISHKRFEHQVSIFNDGDIDDAVQKAIASEGIKVYRSYYFSRWNISETQGSRVTSVVFESRHNEIELPCVAMFMYNEKTVSPKTFFAFNRAGLVFDGSLVIKANCQTNDPNIYAVGTITKYSRRYYADHLAHRFFNTEEIGGKLGESVRKKLIPFYTEEEDDFLKCEAGNMLVPIYEKPLIKCCRLPGNLRYLSVTKPGKQVPLEVAMAATDYGQVLVTGDCKQLDKQGYFRLHLSLQGVVETITCLAKFDIDRVNLTCLWGKHEKLLNNLLMRFEMLTIKDLFEYFREPWACAIYHDRFDSFEKHVQNMLTSLTDESGNSLIEDLLNMYKEQDWSKLSGEQVEELENKFLGSWYHEMLENGLLDFIRQNENFLTMYAHPKLVRQLLTDLENSPLFEPQ